MKTILAPHGGAPGVAKLCGMNWDNMSKAKQSTLSDEVLSRGSHVVLRKFQEQRVLQGRQDKFEQERKKLLSTALNEQSNKLKDESYVDRLQNTSLDDPKEWVLRRCRSRRTIPKKWYIKNIINMSGQGDFGQTTYNSKTGMTYGYSFMMPWLYSLSFPETTFERYFKFGRVIFQDNSQVPSKYLVDNYPHLFFLDEKMEEYVPDKEYQVKEEEDSEFDDQAIDKYTDDESMSEWESGEQDYGDWDQDDEEYFE